MAGPVMASHLGLFTVRSANATFCKGPHPPHFHPPPGWLPGLYFVAYLTQNKQNNLELI